MVALLRNPGKKYSISGPLSKMNVGVKMTQFQDSHKKEKSSQFLLCLVPSWQRNLNTALVTCQCTLGEAVFVTWKLKLYVKKQDFFNLKDDKNTNN